MGKKTTILGTRMYQTMPIKPWEGGLLTGTEMYFLEELRKRNLAGMRWERFGVSPKEMEYMGGKVLELEYEKDFDRARQAGWNDGWNDGQMLIADLMNAGLLDREKYTAYLQAHPEARVAPSPDAGENREE